MKNKINYQKPNSNSYDGTKADRLTNDEYDPFRQHSTNTHVRRRQVRKFKVVQEGDVITKYYWKKWFLFFGQWIPYHNIAGSNDAYARTFIRKIDEFIDALENR